MSALVMLLSRRIIRSMRIRSVLLLAALSISAGCAGLAGRAPPEAAPPAIRADLPCIRTAHDCIALNPDVTQENIGQTICLSGYTQTVRPSTGYTNRVKLKLLRAAGIDAALIGQFELDHIIPLAVGGHPREPSNLMLQPWDGEQGAHRKDLLERRLQGMVCRREISLLDAQRCIAEDWLACNAKLGGR